MTSIDKIRDSVCSKKCGCESCWDKGHLLGHIDLLEGLLKKERAEVLKLKQKVANFDRLKENFRVYREKHVPVNR